jgi:hypothetical protein
MMTSPTGPRHWQVETEREKRRTHELKSWPEFFEPLSTGEKKFELRKNDRDFKVGDRLVMKEWEPNTGKYSGREIRMRVNYIIAGTGPGGITPYNGLVAGYAILGVELDEDDPV